VVPCPGGSGGAYFLVYFFIDGNLYGHKVVDIYLKHIYIAVCMHLAHLNHSRMSASHLGSGGIPCVLFTYYEARPGSCFRRTYISERHIKILVRKEKSGDVIMGQQCKSIPIEDLHLAWNAPVAFIYGEP